MNESSKDSIIDKISDKIDDKLLGLEAKIPLAITPKINPEPMPDDTKSRIRYAALGALTALAASGVVAPLISRGRIKFGKPQIAAITIGTGLATSSIPEIHQAALDRQKGIISNEEAVAIYKEMNDSQKYLDKYISKHMDKTAASKSLFSAGLKGTSKFLGRTGRKLGGEYFRSLTQLPWKGGLGERTFGLATKGLTGYGLYQGAKGLHRRYGGPVSGANYTTFLRNQILAGNVKPSELSQSDLMSVRRLGLK